MKKLIFVYNANSGRLNSCMDSLHKLLQPSTYDCELCDLTHGVFSEKTEWKDFRKELEVETEFLHKDEFKKTYASKFGHKYDYPVILAETHHGIELIISKDELSFINSVDELIQQIKNALNSG
ncbi:GTPase [Christiangramia salexigens]|uniref:GTPase n=1 Tax=Christiangramia salexigens TaxID=1913577 RepID=A0A1L3J7W0_9FLAO|nr:GTPase [Christiangramia salexigens]APG61215.1 GTPase [Christiangramia salexigens]